MFFIPLNRKFHCASNGIHPLYGERNINGSKLQETDGNFFLKFHLVECACTLKM